MVCVTCVLIEQLVPARPPKKLKRRHTSPNGLRLPPVVLRGCFAAKKKPDFIKYRRLTPHPPPSERFKSSF